MLVIIQGRHVVAPGCRSKRADVSDDDPAGMTLIVVVTSVLLVLTCVLSRRRFDMRIRTIRITLTGPLGLGAGVEFKSRFVWNTDSYAPAIFPPNRRDRAVHGRCP